MRNIVVRRHALLILPAFMALLHATLCPAQTVPIFHVNSVADKVDRTPGDGKCDTGGFVDGRTPECTLRAAVDEVNALAAKNPGSSYTVSVAQGTYPLSISDTCNFTPLGSYAQTATIIEMCISANLTLTGADPQTTIIDVGFKDRAFYVSSGAAFTLSNMTVQHGSSFTGGGIDNQGSLTLINDIFSQNQTMNGGYGGAVYNNNHLVVAGSTFRANGDINGSGCYSGAAIQTEGSIAFASIDTSYFTQNHGGQGVAIETYEGTLAVSNSTFSGNIVAQDGVIGLYGGPIASITNSTVSNNTIGNTGAIFGDNSTLTLNNDTVVGNTAGNGPGGVTGRTMIISNTILAGNSFPDCLIDPDGVTDLGHNIVQNATSQCVFGSTTLTGVDPRLGPLQINEGVLPTMSPLANSPALGAGSDATPGSNASGACTALDENGLVRGVGAACTIGAAEALSGLHVTSVIPNHYGAGGSAQVVVIHGSGFVQGSTAVLRSGTNTLAPTQSTISADGYSIAMNLNLSRAAAAVYDVAVTTPSNATTTLSQGFTVGAASTPDTYSYIYGPTRARPGRPAFFSIAYGNRGNVDAYLVPLSLSLPGSFTNLILSSVVSPPNTAGSVVTDWSQIPIQVSPSTGGYTNVPLLIPVIPAGGQGILQISLTPPTTATEGSQFSFNASLGKAYGTSPNGAVDPTALSEFVAGAQAYATKNYASTLTAAELAQLSTFGTAQLAQMVAAGEQALMVSAGSRPIIYGLAPTVIGMAKIFRPIGTHGGGGGGGGSGGGGGGGGSGGAGNLTPPTPVPSPPGPDEPDDCGDEPGWTLDGGNCDPPPPPPPGPDGCPPDADCGPFPEPISVDPNEMEGPLGLGSAHFTLASDAFQYQVEFENSPTATAAAQTVVVTDTIDPKLYDLTTFQLGPISFGPYGVSPPAGLTSWSTSVDMRPLQNVIVLIKANLNASTGVATWSFISLDPATLMLTTDPTAGFLPPDTAPPAGIGHVGYIVKPLAALASGTQLCATASIVFDTNAPLATAPYCNSKDTTAPTSHVLPLPSSTTNPVFSVSWTGADIGAGVRSYSVFVNSNGGPFVPFVSNTAATTASFTGTLGHQYGFYSIATDKLGNTEAAKSTADSTIAIGTAAAMTVPSVVGQSQASATAAVNGAMLILGTVSLQSSATVASGIVISQNPVAGTKVAAKSAVNLVVSSGSLIGDVNGDGVVNCADLVIVKASFGKSTGQAGFDARADVNHDGIVNIVDLSTVSRAIPSGTTCN